MIFSDLEDAVACLDRAFAEWPDVPATKPAFRKRKRSKPIVRGTGGGELFSRNPEVTLKIVGQAGFLVDARTNQIHQLNAMGLALWQLLDEPLEFSSAVLVFAGAFPDVSEAQIRGDLSGLLADLMDAGLVHRHLKGEERAPGTQL
jgi:hypothetical protein